MHATRQPRLAAVLEIASQHHGYLHDDLLLLICVVVDAVVTTIAILLSDCFDSRALLRTLSLLCTCLLTASIL
jgi:hypothetical protein